MGIIPGSTFVKLLPDCSDATVSKYFEQLKSAYQNWNCDTEASVNYCFAKNALQLLDLSKMYVGIDEILNACENQYNFIRRNYLSFHCKIERKKRCEIWLIDIFPTFIPHVNNSLIRVDFCGEKQFPQAETSFLEYLLYNKLADIVKLDSDQAEKGNVFMLYLMYKINNIKNVKKKYEKGRYNRGISIISKFIQATEKVPLFLESESEFIEIPQDKKALSKFIHKLDHKLLSVWGEHKFEDNLKDISISLQRWLDT